jgi:ribosomal peptide maturation radical SAM protein 1
VTDLPPPLKAGAGQARAALLVVPPFSGVDRPNLALHLLQASGRRAGFDVSIFYANLYLASVIGHALYETISYAPTFWLLGERFFAHDAYGTAELSSDTLSKLRNREDVKFKIDDGALLEWSAQADRFTADMAALIAASGYRLVGFTTTFEQTAASVALINRLKSIDPHVLTLIGGANCEGPMAHGIASLPVGVDYIFSGESEETFCRFLQARQLGELPRDRIVRGEPNFSLAQLPVPDYGDYYDQLRVFLPELAASGDVWLPYESSRGCWWGAKHHCTFCGLNAQTMAHRAKPGAMAIEELKVLMSAHPSRKISMVDNIMPHEYFKSFLPSVRSELGDVHIFYEEKANLSLEKVLLLKNAGVNVIQPGIESLSTRVLKLMDKGVSASQNIELLRYARAADLALNWNYLIGFPGDSAEDYWEVVELVPALVHLEPPGGLCGLSIDRFSPYFEQPDRYGVKARRPMSSYLDLLPPDADVFAVAYHFHADYTSGSKADAAMQTALRNAIDRWLALWRQDDTAPPALAVHAIDDETYVLLDSRFDRSDPVVEFIDAERMRLVLAGEHGGNIEALEWARNRRYVVKLDGRWVPLATSDPDTLTKALSARRPELSALFTAEPSCVTTGGSARASTPPT